MLSIRNLLQIKGTEVVSKMKKKISHAKGSQDSWGNLHYHQRKYILSQKAYKNKQYFMLIKGSIYQEDKTIINMYTPKKKKN